MLKKILALFVALYAAVAMAAAVDVNKASAAELDGIKGIGPAISGKIIDERKKGSFKDWQDFIDRVKGVGEGNAAKFSAEGLTVNGSAFKGAAAAPMAKKDDKASVPAAKASAPAVMKEEKKDAKAEAKAKKEADKKAKAEEKAKKAEEAKAKKEEAKAKKDKKADAAKPAASTASAKK
jgi:competence protein ComEA